MAQRILFQQTKHNRRVKKVALAFRAKGYRVWADIAEWGKPGLRNGYRPDVIARKSGMKTVIIEVETRESRLKDKPQIKAFRKYAAAHPRVIFKVIMA